MQQDFHLVLPLGPIFLRTKEEAYLAVMEDDRFYLSLTEEELASCHVLGATSVCAGAVLRICWTDGCFPALYRGEDVAVRRGLPTVRGKIKTTRSLQYVENLLSALRGIFPDLSQRGNDISALRGNIGNFIG